MTINTEELKQLALGLDGKWFTPTGAKYTCGGVQHIADYLTAVAPDNVLALIEELERYKALAKELAKDLQAVVIGIECEHGEHQDIIYLDPTKELLARVGAQP